MLMKKFSQFIAESQLKTGMVFRTTDGAGDLADKLLFVKAISRRSNYSNYIRRVNCRHNNFAFKHRP